MKNKPKRRRRERYEIDDVKIAQALEIAMATLAIALANRPKGE
jgi:hypothetical protein